MRSSGLRQPWRQRGGRRFAVCELSVVFQEGTSRRDCENQSMWWLSEKDMLAKSLRRRARSLRERRQRWQSHITAPRRTR